MVREIEHVRADGRILSESMTLEKMLELGWEPSICPVVRWQYNGEVVEIRHNRGLQAKVLSNRNLVVCLRIDADLETLCVFNADGTVRHFIPNVQQIRDLRQEGTFRWFEELANDAPADQIGVTFEVESNSAMYAMILDAGTGQIIKCEQIS